MIKSKVKRLWSFVMVFMVIITFQMLGNLNVANAEWIQENNSWRYYSNNTMKNGWRQYNGNWYYVDNYGVTKFGWLKYEGNWYYLDFQSGKMLTGWVEEQGHWHYFTSCGTMQIGWLKNENNWYYFDESGTMVKNIYVGIYYLGSDGVWRV